jgi:pimeloyl-ACP methyl ester carboxylesterase
VRIPRRRARPDAGVLCSIPPRYSHLITGLLPHATMKIYPDAAHGFLFQHHAEFAADVTEFLG